MDRYADALFVASGGLDACEAASEDLNALAEALDRVPGARQVLAYPTVRPALAGRLTEDLCKACSPLVGRFIRLLVQKGRIQHLGQIAMAFRERVERARGVTRARLESAREVPAQQMEALRAVLTRTLGGAVVLEAQVLPDLLGGVRVVVGDRVLDGSARAHLLRLRRRLLAAPAHAAGG